MTYKELEKEIKDLNTSYGTEFKVENDGNRVNIKRNNATFASMNNKFSGHLFLWDTGFMCLNDDLRRDLLSCAYEFAQTPIDSRNLFPRFYISSKLTPDDDCRFLFKDCGDIDDLGWGYKDGKGVEFTQDEIDYICEKFHTDLSDFIIEEVEEWQQI